MLVAAGVGEYARGDDKMEGDMYRAARVEKVGVVVAGRRRVCRGGDRHGHA